MSHPLRAPLVARLGEKGFAGVYSLVALATFGWMIWAYPDASGRGAAAVVGRRAMGLRRRDLADVARSVLFMGSLRRNPALPRPGKPIERIDEPHGVFAITRHPMMWGFALWALVHAIVNPTPASLILCAAIAFLALVGAALQDPRRRGCWATAWHDGRARPASCPYGRGSASRPDGFALVGGTSALAGRDLGAWRARWPAGRRLGLFRLSFSR